MVAQVHAPDRHGVPDLEVVSPDPDLLSRETQQDVEFVSLETSVGLELATRGRELRPVQSSTDPRLEPDFDGVAAQIYGAIEATRVEYHPGVLDAGDRDVVEFRDRDHVGGDLLAGRRSRGCSGARVEGPRGP